MSRQIYLKTEHLQAPAPAYTVEPVPGTAQGSDGHPMPRELATPRQVTAASFAGWSRAGLETFAADVSNENRELRIDLRAALDAHRASVTANLATIAKTI